MELQNGDAVVSNGRIYRVDGLGENGRPDEKRYKTMTAPGHEKGIQVIDDIKWVMMQKGTGHTAGVKNVTFRDIYLEKPRPGFSIHFDQNIWSRSYYPGAEIPVQEQLFFDNIRVLYDDVHPPLVRINPPVDGFTITNSGFRNSGIRADTQKGVLSDYFPTRINITNSIFNSPGEMVLLRNEVPGKLIYLNTSGNMEMNDSFSAKVLEGKGKVKIDSDLTGLKN